MSSRQTTVGSGQGSVIRDQGPKSPNPQIPKSLTPSPRRGFTLVELLVVILILAILAGLITAAAVPAVRAARRMVILGEITQLNMALECYKQKYNEYPPDFCGLASSDNTVVQNTKDAIIHHLRQAFPDYQLPRDPGITEPWEQFRLDVKRLTSGDPSINDPGADVGVDVNDMTPAGAMAFWLGGVAAPDKVSTKLIPMSTNPANPFYIGGTSADPVFGSRLEPFYEFDEGRLVQDENNVFYYKPPHVKDPDGGTDAAPYVYFRASSSEPHYDPYTGSNDNREQYFAWGEDSFRTFCVPYAKDAVDESGNMVVQKWFSPNTCQIICCGLDGMYAEQEADGATEPDSSRLPRYLCVDGEEETGNLAPEEDDNLTNFSKGTLGDWNERK